MGLAGGGIGGRKDLATIRCGDPGYFTGSCFRYSVVSIPA